MDVNQADEMLDMYRRAVEQNAGNDRLRPVAGTVHVQLMPEINRRGDLILPGKPKALGNRRIWCRYGTVINVGADVPMLGVGDVVFFSNMLGIRFRGYGNPLKLKDRDVAHSDDEIRILKVSEEYTEVWGRYTPHRVGTTITFDKPGDGVMTAEVVDESPAYGGYLKIREGDHESWVPYKWLCDAEE